jgi:NAD(P)-dependent dehydrogenase (short-subunit alcohol dehydrogenase family)
MELTGISALVTGGASGIGAACADSLVERGAQVVIADIHEPTGHVPGSHPRRSYLATDITDAGQVTAAVDLAMSLAPLRVVVAAAGIAWLTRTIGRDGSFGSAHGLEEFRRVLEVNTVGTFNTVRLAASAMSRTAPDPSGTRGAIVLLASAAAFEGQTGQVAYAASKAALVGMTLPLARDLSAAGIRVNTLSPGVVDTPIYGSGPEGRVFQDQQVEGSVLFPKRAGRPDEMASMAIELLTNSYCNAQTVRVDAGLRLQPGVASGWRGVGRS